MKQETGPFEFYGTSRERKIQEAQMRELKTLQETGNPIAAMRSAGLLLDSDLQGIELDADGNPIANMPVMLTDTSPLTSKPQLEDKNDQHSQVLQKNRKTLFG